MAPYCCFYLLQWCLLESNTSTNVRLFFWPVFCSPFWPFILDSSQLMHGTCPGQLCLLSCNFKLFTSGQPTKCTCMYTQCSDLLKKVTCRTSLDSRNKHSVENTDLATTIVAQVQILDCGLNLLKLVLILPLGGFSPVILAQLLPSLNKQHLHWSASNKTIKF